MLKLQTDASFARHQAPEDQLIAAALMENDRRYFRAGATIEQLSNWKIIWTPGFRDLPAACVIEPLGDASFPPPEVLDRLRALGIPEVRFYHTRSILKALPLKPDYAVSQEIAYLTDASSLAAPEFDKDIHVRPLRDTEDNIKVALFESRDKRPDGKASDARDYVALERLKIDCGYMQGFIIEYRGTPAACFGLSISSSLVRMKNLLTSKNMTGRGCGTAIVQFAIQYAQQQQIPHVGVFAIKGGSGQRLYERCGMRPVGIQTEFSAPLRASLNGSETCQ
ncbi:MAG: GNAT family N-acetyltransferase [Henriciella sp.]